MNQTSVPNPSKFNSSHRPWVLPILRALEHYGGAATPAQVRAHIGQTAQNHLTPAQWKYILKNGRIGWTRCNMKNEGLLGGESGTWEITGLGRLYLEEHGPEPMAFPSPIPEFQEADTPAPEAPVTESVLATEFRGYQIPLLQLLSDGPRAKTALFADLYPKVSGQLLPGDLRRMAQGEPVWSYRASWALSNLSSSGHVENVSRGVWQITEAGREWLRAEEKTWTLAASQGSSKAQVMRSEVAAHVTSENEPASQGLERLQRLLSTELYEDVVSRLRLDLPPTTRERPLRNLVFYGPPGTGKTFVAREVARCLTGEMEPSDQGRWRLVQFHPSYAYEDFVLGIRPNLKETTLRYEMAHGPFHRIATAAEGDPDHYYVLIIDEINRGDPARIFGELLYGLEYRDEQLFLASGERLLVPSNLVVLGTMNSVDRSVALVDYALRRRFAFVRLAPDPEVLRQVIGDARGLAAATILENLNQWLTRRLDQEHTLGHSFFLNPAYREMDARSLERLWNLDVRPLLEEFFFGSAEALAEAGQEWRKAARLALEEESDDGA